MNVFENCGFFSDVQKLLKARPNREELSKELRNIAKYYYWHRCEWEVLLSSWVQSEREGSPKLKIDVYDQLNMNWDSFVDYVWQFVPKERSKSKKAEDMTSA